MKPMLASPASSAAQLPTDPAQWAFEVKWDGMRVLADLHEGRLRLTSRTGNDVSVSFPDLADLAAVHPDVLLDGEVVVLRDGRPSFSALAERFHVQDARRAKALAAAAPATFIAFDVLRLYGVDLTGRPGRSGARPWSGSPPPAGRGSCRRCTTTVPRWWRPPSSRASRGWWPSAGRPGTPRAPAPATGSSSRTSTCRPASSAAGGRRSTGRTGIGALLLGIWDGDGRVLRYAGRAGSGLTGSGEADLRRLLAPLRLDASPFGTPVPPVDAAGATWTAPQVVVEVRHLGHTDGGRLRQPVLRGIRTDLAAAEVRLEG